MSNGTESLVSRRSLWFLSCLVVAFAHARETSAQFTSAIDLSSRTSQASTREWQSQLAVSPFARYDHPRLSIDGRWTAIGGDGQRMNGFGNLGATYFSPTRSGLQLSVAGFTDRSLLNETFAVTSLGADTRLSYRAGHSGVWLGREVMRDNKSTSVSPVADVSAGAWRQWKSALVTFSLSSFASREGARGPRYWTETRPSRGGPSAPAGPDTGQQSTARTLDTLTFGDSGSIGSQHNWNDAEVALHWNAGPIALRGVIGARFLTANQPNEKWGLIQGSLALAPEVALIATGGVHPSSVAYGIARGRFMELGFRVAPSVLRQPRLPVGVRPIAAAFTISDGDRGQRTLRIRVPSARTVELSGDFTSWKPIALKRVDDDRWEATLAIPAGIHRVAIRVDGDKWSPPPGVSSIPDEFQGVVGVIVVK